ncbi:AAA family ATPase, partial [candidate division KSB1 bacterium]|nr:AAA family ATPase [candidate division KSB1 bacterium]
MSNTPIPSPDDLRKEISEFLKSKYGDRVVVPPEADREGKETGGTSDKKKMPEQINFDLKPSELESYLLNYVVGQNETVEVLATKICTHFNRMRLERSLPDDQELLGHIKSNILMLGPTGVGKTFLIKLIAQKIGVPFVKGDATKFSETGYVGGDVEDLVRSLVHDADGDIKLAEYGIIYLDEIDKIASSGSVFGPDVSRTGVQRNLLKLMEESEVDLKTPNDLAAQMEAAMEAQRTGKVTR